MYGKDTEVEKRASKIVNKCLDSYNEEFDGQTFRCLLESNK